MKLLKELKETIREAVSPERKNFDVLVRAGLMDKSLLPKLHRVLDKIQKEGAVLSSVERQLVVDLLNHLTQLVTGNMSIFQKTRQAIRAEESMEESTDSNALGLTSGEPPPLLVLRRKAIRMYPHQTKIALYYNDKLNRYFSVPFVDEDTPDQV